MTTIFWIVTAAAVLLLAVNKGLLYLFRNQKQPHQLTPQQYRLSFDPVRFPTKKGLSLYGWWIPAEDEAVPTLILVHGWGRNVERCLPYIQHLHITGYKLLAFDSRNHGSSDGDGLSSMPKFSEDILAAVDFVTQEKGAEAVGIIKTPILLIHGENDATIPLEHGRRLLKAARESASLWIVPGKGHSDCHLHPQFWTRLQTFLSSGFR